MILKTSSWITGGDPSKAGYMKYHAIILNRELWERSGHWFHYKENVYNQNR